MRDEGTRVDAIRLCRWLGVPRSTVYYEIDANVAESLTVLAMPPEHRRRLRTSNAIEQLDKEIKRRTRVATLFPNADSLLWLFSAVLAEVDEVDEEWTAGRIYLDLAKASE